MRLLVTDVTRYDEPIDRLVVIVRPLDYVPGSLRLGADRAKFLPPRAMADDLAYFLAVDSPETIRTANVDDLKRWKVGPASAWRRATANLKARIGPLTMVRPEEGGASGIFADSGLAPSLLADPDFCGPSAPSGLHGQIVLAYTKDVLLLAVPSDAVQSERFWRTVAAETVAKRSMSFTPLACRGGRWVVAQAPQR